MIIKPDWNIFKAKFSANPQDAFEWFAYLLFCREHNLDKGWFGYKNQSGIEKKPLELDDKVIGFQAKFYDVPLSSKKTELIKTLNTTNANYPDLTHLIIYTNQLWGEGDGKEGQSKALIAIEKRASELGIKIIWNEHSFFESEFVTVENNDLARHFFTNDDYKGWDRFKDWSSTQSDINAPYFIDDDIKVILPNQNIANASNIIEGIDAIRNELRQPKKSVRLVGLSGVGKTRLAQALFDERIGENALDVREVWYCDYGESPDPLPLHFIAELEQQNKKSIVIVDNCGRDQHEILTKAITNNNSQISLLTIEYDISVDDQPEKTSVFKLEPNSPVLVQKVIESHYPEIINPIPHTIAQLTGGNYRLALAIASTIENVDNIAVLNDQQLFKRLFYQNGQINEENYKIAQVFSLVFSFNIKDLSDPNSELKLLADIAEVSPRTAKHTIESLKTKDIVQQRGDYRAILPHVLANHLSKQALKWIDEDDLHDIFISMPSRLQRSLIKRLSYLHDIDVVNKFIQTILDKEGFIGKKLLDGTINEDELNYLRLLSHIEPKVVLDLIEARHTEDSLFLTNENPHISKIQYLLKNLSYEAENFEQSFNLLFVIAKDGESNASVLGTISSMFDLYTSESLARLELKKTILQRLFDEKEFEILLRILESAIDFNSGGIIYSDSDNGLKKENYGYQPETYGEIWNCANFLLNLLNELDKLNFKEAKEIFARHLKSLMRYCYNRGFIEGYILDFNSREPFIKALIALNELIEDDYENLLKSPQTLKNLQSLVIKLQPKLNELEQLIQHYILLDMFELAKYEAELGKNYSIKIPNFANYNYFIDYISKELATNNNLLSFLPLLLSSDNPHLEYIGKEIYPKLIEDNNLDTHLKRLTKVSINRKPYLLLGLLKELKANSFNNYKSTVLSLLETEGFKQVIPWLTLELSQNNADYDFICELLDLKLEVDYQPYAWISVKKENKTISVENFEKVFDSLIENNYNGAIDETFRFESTYMQVIPDKYASILIERLPSVFKSHQTFDLERILLLLLSNRKSVDRTFDAFIEILNAERFISLTHENKSFIALKTLIKNDTKQFIEKFIENGYLKFNTLLWGSHDLLFYANENDVINWIEQDQEIRTDFWIENAGLLKVEEQIGQRKIHWHNLTAYFINRSSNPTAVIDKILKNNIYEIHSWTGSYSQEMKSRLDIFDSFDKYLVDNSLDKYIPHVDFKKRGWIEAIKAQELAESEKAKKDEGFDY